ncbi:MAG: SH3 domain-containing protein [Anaerolineae bacterium]
MIASFDSDTIITSNSAASSEPCTVSADAANSAQLRVGPGTNRGAISFLPANTDVTVTGRNELDDGSVWYQLDKSEAAPNGTAAAELWVNAEDVSATGDCEHVGDTSAPPIIPIAVAPPAATTAPGENPPVQASPGMLPAAGGWIIDLAGTTNASCLGGENVPIPSTEVFESLSYGVTVLIVNNSTFTFGGDTFTRVPGSNNFIGSFTYDDGSNAQVYFYLTSPTFMSGQIVGNVGFGDSACSATVQFTTHRG